jgi:hypothetical protein
MIDNASVSLVELDPEHNPRVLAIGWNPHPGWLKLPVIDNEKIGVKSHKHDEQKS